MTDVVIELKKIMKRHGIEENNFEFFLALQETFDMGYQLGHHDGVLDGRHDSSL